MDSRLTSARQEAFAKATSRKPLKFERPLDANGLSRPASQFFGCHVFGKKQLEKCLTSAELAQMYGGEALQQRLTFELADKVASAAKEWAIAKGASHFTHWFQPQTAATAEKHDSFLSFNRDGSMIEKFTGKLLMQQEPDASSFPSGGRRSTFEARGYTAWDATSPMFLRETTNGLTLCIPSVFVSYSGESLDKKTPLLRSVKTLSDAATESLHLMGHTDVDCVHTTCGPEQEYFVIDKALYSLRPDLVLTGRSLVGRLPPKGQQMEDHYFGTIKDRVLSFMMECELELQKLGVPCKTRHNEVAPSQFELAAIYEFANVAADHNQVVMEVLKSVAEKHDLVVLFHEKPYAGVNGSGKHLNWSLEDSVGRNLLDPGDTPEENLRFLFFLIAAVKAVHDQASLLRTTVASAGNDFRLGANEAPPAIMSAFLGSTISTVLNSLESGASKVDFGKSGEIDLDLARIGVIAKDNTDRNRTSPFAFTGNKFEFRALGASQSICYPAAFLNAAVAASLRELNALLGERLKNDSLENAMLSVIVETYAKVKKVCFDGNGYSNEWHQEAKRRGLPEAKTTPEALASLRDRKTQDFLVASKIFGSADEVESRYNVLIERYVKLRLIELETLLEICNNMIVPAGFEHLRDLGDTLFRLEKVRDSKPSHHMRDELHNYEKLLDHTISCRNKLETFLEKLSQTHGDETATAAKISTEGAIVMEELRRATGDLELKTADSKWPLPKLREILFSL